MEEIMKRYNNSSSPNKEWKINEYLGNPFEDFIHNMIRNQVKDFYPHVKVEETPRVSDGGKDIIVYSDLKQIEILGQTFVSKNYSLTIYFECKSTNNSILRYDKLAPSISRVQHEKIDYYVLVTNSTIIPQAYWFITKEFDNTNNGIHFVLIDSFLLGTYLVSRGHEKELNNPYTLSDSADFYYDYQVEFLPALNNDYNIYIYFRNYTDNDKYCELQLSSDIDWYAIDEKTTFIIPPRETTIKKILVKREHFDGFEDLLFRLQINGQESIITINGIKGIQDFETPFFGESRKGTLSKIINGLRSNDLPRLLCFWGDSGIGKTRMTKELYYNLKGTIFDFLFIKIQPSEKYLSSINLFLYEKGYVKNAQYNNLFKLISNCKSTFNNHAIIIIDDLHYASKELLDELKTVANTEAPITLILCGRTDYSIGDINYNSFVYWCNTNLKQFSYNLSPLTDEETKSFIRSIIDGIPESAIERLSKLSMNNPLFIVQYIEYLLDNKLVKLINRNTVGIIDINSFHAKKSIPPKISDIYKLRVSNLQSTDFGKECLDVLLAIVLCDGRITYDFFSKYINNDNSCVLELYKRRFISCENTNEISIIHESLFTYLYSWILIKKRQLKELSSSIIQNPSIELELDSFHLGRLCVFSKEYSRAINYFAPIILWVKKADNISNLNVDMNYYKYLNDVFEVLRTKKTTLPLAKKALLMRIYITLHHLTPINAVNECDDVLNKLDRYKLNNDEEYNLSIQELKAHALMNSALYQDGETILKEIQVKWIADNHIINDETLFDLYDRLSSVYRHFNLKGLAEKYNELSRNLALEHNSNELIMLSDRTKFKIHIYTKPQLSFDSICETIQLNKITPLERIQMDNALDECGYNILINKAINIDTTINTINEYLHVIEKKDFHRAKIHAYYLMAICLLLKNEEKSIKMSKSYIEMALDLSTSYGIVKYLWRLNNLYGIVKMRLHHNGDDIYKTFNTVFDILKNRGLLFIGNCDLCHGNILALSNIGYYLHEHKFENLFHELMGQVSYAGKNRNSMSDSVFRDNPKNQYIVKQFILAKEKKVLFVKNQPEYLIRDKETNYIIII